MTNFIVESLERYETLITQNPDIRLLSNESLVDLGSDIFCLIVSIDRFIKENNISISSTTFIQLYDIKDVSIHLMDFPEKLFGNKEDYLNKLQIKYRRHQNDVSLFLNRLQING